MGKELKSSKERPIILRPIGFVRSRFRDTFTIPLEGSRAQIIIEKEYAKAIHGIEDFSHLFVICWLHLADTAEYRKVLRIRPVRIDPKLPEQGAFASRSPIRPNPLSLTVVRLLEARGNTLTVGGMDAIDGTPVVDIKPYSPVGDSLPSALASGIPLKGHEDYLTGVYYREAVNFHGKGCPEIAIGTRMIIEGLSKMGVRDVRDPNVKVTCLKTGCLADAVQSIMGATIGGGRLVVLDKVKCSLIMRRGKRAFSIKLNPQFKIPKGREGAIKNALGAKAQELLVFTRI